MHSPHSSVVGRFRWRFYAAEAGEGWRQIRVLATGAFRFALGRLGWRRRWPAQSVAALANPKPWPRTAALATAFGRTLAPVLPEGVTLTGGSGKALHYRDTRRGGGGFIGMAGAADMPQAQPKDLAKELQNTMRTLTKLLTRIYGAQLDPSWPPGAFHARAEGDMIRCWWQLPDGRVTVRLADIALAELDA